MADEEIRIDYVTSYITHGHGDYVRKSDVFARKLQEGTSASKDQSRSMQQFRRDLEATNPVIAQTTKALDRLYAMERRGLSLTRQQEKDRRRLITTLRSERAELENLTKAATQNERALQQLTSRLDALGESHVRNARKTNIFRQQVDNLTLRSTRRAISGVHEWATTIGTIIAPAVPQFLSLLSGALGTAATAAVGAGSSIAKLGPGIGAVGVAVSGLVQAMGTWKLAMRDMDKLIESAMFDNLDDFVKTLEDFTPAAQEFAVTMRTKVKPALDEWQKIAQGNIFGGINRGVNALLPRRGLITDIVSQTSRAMGGAIGDFGQELARPDWARAFKELGTNNARWIEQLGKAAIPTARALRDLTLAGQPIVEWAVDWVSKGSKAFESFILGKKASGELARGVEAAKARLEDFADIAGSTAGSLMSVLRAGQGTGDMLTKGLRDQANQMQQWTRSFEGQRRMSEWFINMQPAMVESGKLMKDLAGTIARTAEQSSFDVLIRQLRADLLPTLEETMINVNRSMGPLLIETVVNLLQAFTSATSPNGPVHMLVQGINQLAQAFQKMTEIPVVSTLMRWGLGFAALWRVVRLSGLLVGGRGVLEMLQAGRNRQQLAMQRTQLQGNLEAQLGRAYPMAMVQPRGINPRTGRSGFVRGPRVFDFSRLPPEAQQAYGQYLGVQQPGFFQRLRSGEVGQDWRTLRERGMSRFGAMRGTFRGGGMGGGLGMIGIGIGSIAAAQGAGALGASGRVQNVLGMAGMGAGIGLAGGPWGAAIGAVAGGLAGLGISFLSAKKTVDDFAAGMSKATAGLAATQQATAQLRRNQKSLELGVRGAEIELRSAVSARDALTAGMTDRQFTRFQKTDTFRAAQLRVDVARNNLNDLRNALRENTEQLRIANAKLRQDLQRPRQFIQGRAGQAGRRLREIDEQIRNLREGGVGMGERPLMQRLQKQRREVIRDFARQMTQASREAAANAQPFFARMFANAAAQAMRDNRITVNFSAAIRRATNRGVAIQVAPAAHVNPSQRDFRPGQGRMGGGRITWGSPTADSAPAMLAQGEFVVTGGGEQMLEQMTFPGVLNWLEQNQPPHFQKGGRMRGYANGGFIRRAILAPFQGSFSSGFSAGVSRTPDAIAGLYSDLVASGTFEATPSGGRDRDNKDKKSKNYTTTLAKAGPKVKALAKLVESLVAKGIPYVAGGGHGRVPGPSKPTMQSLLAQGYTHAQAKIMALESPAGLDHTGFVRMALARGGFGDPGSNPNLLATIGRKGPGNYLTVYSQPGNPAKAYVRIAGTDFGYFGRGKNLRLGSRGKTTMNGFNANHFGKYRRGGRVGRAGYQTGGRVGGGVAIPHVTGAAGPAANQAWASGVANYLASLEGATLNSITSAINSLGSQVVALTQNADQSPAGQQLLARVSSLLEAAQFALGEQLGKAQALIEDMGEAMARRRGQLERFLREREIPEDSPRGLAQELTQLRRERFGPMGLGEQIQRQRALVAQAAGTQEAEQLQQRLEELILMAAENATQRVVTRRGLARARDQKPVDQFGFSLENRNFELERLQLRQQIAGRAGTTGANAELSKFIEKQLVPVMVQREKAAHTAMVRERQRSGRDSEAFRAAQDQWQAAVLERLGAQAQAAEKTADNTSDMARHLSGPLAFDFMGERTTDLLSIGTGV